jgi:beta-mannosidase
MQIQTLTGDWQFRQVGSEDWLPASVPGSVHIDLLALGRIPDPFVADHEKDVQWVAEADWEYRFGFHCSPDMLSEDRIVLVCDGLDTLATVKFNGYELGHTNNMFRQYCWDVKPLLRSQKAAVQPAAVKPAANELLITFASPVRYATEKQAQRPLPGVQQAIPGGPYLRKSPCQFGWDWGPQLPATGIWKNVRLEGYSAARLDEIHLRQVHEDGQVIVETQVGIQRWIEEPVWAAIRITTPDGEVLSQNAAVPASDRLSLKVPVHHPQLWWPNGYGDQPLYQVEISLDADDSSESRRLDQRADQLGLRTVELRQGEDQWGRSFTFVVNGEPIFVKGSNWIPADSFPTRITDEHLDWLIQSAAETHQNMLRVWGGGFYEDERFYDLCDCYGILIWQEFIFSCSIYPLNDVAFLENVHAEVVQNIRRLRHRACLALWCGNNEMELGWMAWGWDRPELQDLKQAYDQFFNHSLPAWCAAEDPDHSYWPSSPSSGIPFEEPNGSRQGDAHYWEVWHGRKPFTAYRDQYPRFMSEFGFQSLPPLATVRSFADEKDWNISSYVMEQHQKNTSGNTLIVAQMADHFRMPKDFPSLVYLSMVLQSEGIRYGVEHWRRHQERVAGTLYWQLNDCWPATSWSSLDYFGRWKALHYVARRFYAPLMLSIEDKALELGIFVTSDLDETWAGAVRWSLESLHGDVLVSGEVRVNTARRASVLVTSIDLANHVSDSNQKGVIFIAELWQGDWRAALQVATFAPTKHLSLADPLIRATVHDKAGQLSIDLTSRSLARLVELSLEGAETVFSDNYFDLPARRSVTVSCPLPAGWTIERARTALKIRSIYDTYTHYERGY